MNIQLSTFKTKTVWKLFNWFRDVFKKKNGLFTVRLTVRVDPPLPPLTVRVLWFFQNKFTYFDLFYHFIMGKIRPKFSHLLTVRAEGADPPLPPLTVSLNVKRPFFLLTTSLNKSPTSSDFIYQCINSFSTCSYRSLCQRGSRSSRHRSLVNLQGFRDEKCFNTAFKKIRF